MDVFLDAVTEQFNNREIAVAFWLLVLMIWAIRDSQIRKGFVGIVKAFFQRKVLPVFLLLGGYVWLIIFGLERLGLWNTADNLKDTIIWAITGAFVMVIHVSDAAKNREFFRNTIKDAVKLAIILEFVVGFYPFSLPVEFVFIPFMALLGGMLAISETKEEYLPLNKVLRWLLSFIGLFLIWHTARNIVADGSSLVSLELLLQLLLPSVLTIALLPFIYFLALGFAYEQLFMRLKFQNPDSGLVGYAKRRIFIRFGLNLNKLNAWSRQNLNLKMTNKESVLDLVGKEIRPASSSGITQN